MSSKGTGVVGITDPAHNYYILERETMDHNNHLLVILKMIYMLLVRAIEKTKADLPKELHRLDGTGTLLDPHVDVVPQLDPLYELSTMIDNLIFILEKKS